MGSSKYDKESQRYSKSSDDAECSSKKTKHKHKSSAKERKRRSIEDLVLKVCYLMIQTNIEPQSKLHGMLHFVNYEKFCKMRSLKTTFLANF